MNDSTQFPFCVWKKMMFSLCQQKNTISTWYMFSCSKFYYINTGQCKHALKLFRMFKNSQQTEVIYIPTLIHFPYTLLYPLSKIFKNLALLVFICRYLSWPYNMAKIHIVQVPAGHLLVWWRGAFGPQNSFFKNKAFVDLWESWNASDYNLFSWITDHLPRGCR